MILNILKREKYGVEAKLSSLSFQKKRLWSLVFTLLLMQ